MTDLQVVFGLHAVKGALITSPDRVCQVYVSQQRQDQRMQTILDLAQEADVVVETVTTEELDHLAAGQRHQGVVIEMSVDLELSPEALLKRVQAKEQPSLILGLDGVQDPHNLGACLRSADVFGVEGLIAARKRTVAVTPVVRKVACGAAERVPVVAVTNLVRAIEDFKDAGCWVLGASVDPDISVPINQLDLPKNRTIVLMMGAEGKGLRKLTKEACDGLIHIPMHGETTSLNVSVATGICLYAVKGAMSQEENN